jgi:hypothetical protein
MDFFDEFDGPNGPLNGPIGSPWLLGGAGTWMIVDGKVVHTSGGGSDAAVVDVGEANVNVITPLSGANVGQFIRYIDINNSLIVVAGTGSVDGLWKIVSGVSTRILPTVAILGNAFLEVLCVDDTIRIAANDVVLGTYTMTAPEAAQFTTPTKFGLRAFGAQNQSFDYISINRYIGNVELYPSDVNLDTAISSFGINLGSQAFSRWAYELAVQQGVTEIRWQFGWEFAEPDVDSPGVYSGVSLPIVTKALKWCTELKLRPLIVAGYGPARKKVMDVHINGEHPVGSTILSVDEDLSGFDLDFGSHFVGSVGVGLGKASYYGGVIVNVSTNTIELGAATTGIISDGTIFPINKLMYGAISTDSGTDTSAVAFANYAHALAMAISENCPDGGAIELWNEPPWNGDSWDELSRFFDNPAAHGVAQWGVLLSPITKAVAGMTWPENVEVYSSANNKTGGHSALNVLSKEELFPIVADTYHPYDIEPEVYWWGRGPTCVGTNFGLGYRNVIGTSSFAAGAKLGDSVGFRRRITECGYGGVHSDPDWIEGMKSYSIRKIIGALSMGFEMINFYSLTDAPYPMSDPTTHQSYLSLLRIGQFLRFLKSVNENINEYTLPSIRYYDGDLPLFRVNIGPILACWQRSSAGAAPTYKPQWPPLKKLQITEVPGKELLIFNTVRRVHESINSDPSGEKVLYVGAEPLILTWRNVV